MKYFGFAVALVVLIMSVILLRAELRSMDDERSEWHTERDSLRMGWEATLGELRAQRDTTDAVRAERDSAMMFRMPDTVYVTKAWRRVKLMDINAKMDSLKSQ